MDPAAPEAGTPAVEGTFAAARLALEQAARVAEAALAVLRAELRLARTSALLLVVLAAVMVLLGLGAWFALNAALAAGIWELTGHLFYGIGAAALANLAGMAAVLLAMRRCWRDLALPRTRRMLGGLGHAPR
jgi:hypothetical protein